MLTDDDGLLLLALDDPPALLACWSCEQPYLLGAYGAAVDLGGDGRAPLCQSCAGVLSPALAAVVEALCLIAATSRDLPPALSVRLVCSMAEEIAKICGPTLTVLNVNSSLIAKIEGLTRK